MIVEYTYNITTTSSKAIMAQENRKVVLVTGSSSGIGEAIAYEYAKLNYNVVLTGRNENRLGQVVAKCTGLSPSKLVPLAVKADFVDIAQVENVFNKTIEKFKRLDILVNNAGFAGKMKKLDDGADFMADYHKIMSVNLTSALRLSQLALPYLKETKGSIVNISSIASRLGLPSVSYSVSKAGMSMLTKCLANAVGSSGVRVNTVSPGPVKTNLAPGLDQMGGWTAVDRVGEPQEIADFVVFLTSGKANFIQGAELDIDGGATIKAPKY